MKSLYISLFLLLFASLTPRPTYAIDPDEYPSSTVAQFIDNQGGKCQLRGVVGTIDNTTYGNFTFTDESGSIYIYGLLTANGESKKFSTLGVVEDDTLTLAAETYQLYDGKHEVVNAIFMEVKKPGAIEIPGCDYPELDGKSGAQILAALHNKIVNHTVLSYSAVWASNTGADNKSNGTIWDMYSDCVFDPYDDKCGSGESSSDCECYNREHSLPKSWWGHDEYNPEPMYTDLVHLVPTDRLANSQRSAWPLGEVTTTTWTNGSSKLGYGTFGNDNSNLTFEPADEYKGDFARIYFYMATCYSNKNFTAKGKGYKVFVNGTAEFTTTAQNLYMKWHREDPVSEKEINRNNVIQSLQGNRNPFVDNPELAEYIWGNKSSETYLCSEETPDEYAFSVSYTGQGTVTSDKPDGNYPKNTVIQIEAKPATNWTFTGWSDGSTSAKRSITLTQDTNLVAAFASTQQFKVTIKAAEGGTVKPKKSEELMAGGTSLSIQAIPDDDYRFVEWQEDGETEEERTIVISRDTVLTAIFEEISYYKLTVEIYPDDAGTVLFDGKEIPKMSKTVEEGTTIKLTAEPEPEFLFDYYEEAGKNDVEDEIYTVKMNRNRKINANLKKKPQDIDLIFDSSNPRIFKVLKDGQLFIIRGDNCYTLTGQQIR